MQHQRPTYKTPGPVLTGTALSFMIRGSNQAPTSLTTPPHKPSIEPKKPSARPHRRPKPRVETRTRPPAEPKRREPVKEPEAPKPEPEVPKIDPKITAASAGPISEPEAPEIEEKTKETPVEQPAAPKSDSKTDPIIVIPPPPPVKDSEISSDEEADLKSVSSEDEEQEGADETADKEESSSDEEDDNKSVQSTKDSKAGGKKWASTLMDTAASAASALKSGAGAIVKTVKETYKKGVYEEDKFYMFDDTFKEDGALLPIREILEQHMQHLLDMEVFMWADTMCYFYRKQWTQWFIQEFNAKFPGIEKMNEKKINQFYKNLKNKLSDDEYNRTSNYTVSDTYPNQKYLYFIYGWGNLLPTGDYTNYNAFMRIIDNEKSSEVPDEDGGGGYHTVYHQIKRAIILPSPGPIILEQASYQTEYKALAQRIALLVKQFQDNPEFVSLMDIERDRILVRGYFIGLIKKIEAEKWSVKTIV